jgi:hypothetical protein
VNASETWDILKSISSAVDVSESTDELDPMLKRMMTLISETMYGKR